MKRERHVRIGDAIGKLEECTDKRARGDRADYRLYKPRRDFNPQVGYIYKSYHTAGKIEYLAYKNCYDITHNTDSGAEKIYKQRA